MAAVIGWLDQPAADTADLELPLLRRDHEQHVIAGRLRTTSEVGEIGGELAVKASCLFASSIQLEVKKQLTLAHEHPAPAVWHRPPLFRIGPPDAVLPDPVVETQRRHVTRGPREIDEQLIGFQVVHEVVVAGEGVLCSQDVRPRIISEEMGDGCCAAAAEQEDRSTPDVARTDDSVPGVHQAVFYEPLEAVLAASWSLEEESLDLVPVEIAVAVQRLQDRDVSFCEPDYLSSGDATSSESKFYVWRYGLRETIERGPSRRPIRLI